ncbi:nuclear transport factor 2 family protein [Actinomycetota bacterium Odt1-20B]
MKLTKEYLTQVLNQVSFGSEEEFPLEEVAARYFSPAYTQLTDGVPANFEEFVAHIRLLRKRVAGGHIVVDRLVQDGNTFADRHTVAVDKLDGSSLTAEVHLFGEVDDSGRLLWVEEVSRMVEGGTEADADLAHAR